MSVCECACEFYLISIEFHLLNICCHSRFRRLSPRCPFTVGPLGAVFARVRLPVLYCPIRTRIHSKTLYSTLQEFIQLIKFQHFHSFTQFEFNKKYQIIILDLQKLCYENLQLHYGLQDVSEKISSPASKKRKFENDQLGSDKMFSLFYNFR